MIIINKSIKSPIKESVLNRLYCWHNNFATHPGSRCPFTDADWNNDKYKNSVILNNISTLIYGYINEHQKETDFKEKFDEFICGLIDEVNRLFV